MNEIALKETRINFFCGCITLKAKGKQGREIRTRRNNGQNY